MPEPTCRACQLSAPDPCWNHAPEETEAREIEHDDDCDDAIRYGGACRHYCPSGCCEVGG